MPLWVIYHPPSTFTSLATKQAFAQEITSIYTAASLPAFYVNVIFQRVDPENIFIGGVPRPSVTPTQPNPDYKLYVLLS
jgi:phenylpyruvate tautomerase PptA (4-oxalocrotonate tautomerase family)